MTPALRDRLVKVCAMLASPHDGERAAAALLASRMLAEAGLTWADVIAPPAAAPAPRRSPLADYDPAGPYWREGGLAMSAVINRCLARCDLFSAAELGFLLRLMRRKRPLTPKEIAQAELLFARLRRAPA